MTMSSGQLSRDLARSLGERYNRSASRRFADGLFGTSSDQAGLDAVHQLMMATTASVIATPAQYRGQVAILLGLGLLTAWIRGEQSWTTSPT